MDQQILAPGLLGLIGCWLVGNGVATWRRPGLIAGFTPARCSDVQGLARWVGNGGVFLGGVCTAAAILMLVMPDRRPLISGLLAAVTVGGVIAIIVGARRFSITGRE